jgi:hypothetical protein
MRQKARNIDPGLHKGPSTHAQVVYNVFNANNAHLSIPHAYARDREVLALQSA